jgi:hypothetical protein
VQFPTEAHICYTPSPSACPSSALSAQHIPLRRVKPSAEEQQRELVPRLASISTSTWWCCRSCSLSPTSTFIARSARAVVDRDDDTMVGMANIALVAWNAW